MEGWVSGLNQQFAKLSGEKSPRGFESRPLRNGFASGRSPLGAKNARMVAPYRTKSQLLF